eukprot:5135331-Prymnesium_polylepis.1
MVPATLAVGLLSGCCQVGYQAAVRCCQIVTSSTARHCQALSAFAGKAVKPGLNLKRPSSLTTMGSSRWWGSRGWGGFV